MTGRSHRANHFGTAAEEKLSDEYGLQFARKSWCDAEMKNGKPVEMKSTMLEHADGQPGNFKIYEKFHRKLRRHNGHYAFAVYKPYGGGIRVVKSKLIHSSQVPRLSWHGGGSHRDTRQAKLSIGEVF